MSGGQGDDRVTVEMNQMLDQFSYTPSNPSIFRVNDRLRSANEKAYEPTIIAIGPLHRDKEALKKMEDQKKRYLQLLRESKAESSVARYVEAIASLEPEARKCYEGCVTMGRDEFVQMLVLDGIFIVQFLREYDRVDGHADLVAEGDPIFQFPHVKTHILYDLVLLENQIPFFIVEKLFELSKVSDEEEFCDLFWPLLEPSEAQSLSSEMLNKSKAPHLLGLVHYVKCSSFARIIGGRNFDQLEMKNINSATELKEAGISFRTRSTEDTSWLDIVFSDKIIHFPTLEVTDVSESWFRNMVAYEQHFSEGQQRFISDYTYFLHCLVHTPSDAQLLRRYSLVSNWLGGDDMVCHLIKKLGTDVQISLRFSYTDVFYSINRHCEQRRHKWIAILRRDYFNSPWTLVSVIAGFILLATGVVQMVFAILSYRNDDKKKGR